MIKKLFNQSGFSTLSLLWNVSERLRTEQSCEQIRSDEELQLLLMCCFLRTAAVVQVKGQQWQHGVHTLARKTTGLMPPRLALQIFTTAVTGLKNKYRLQDRLPAVFKSSNASSLREHTSSCVESVLVFEKKKEIQAFSLSAGIERMAVDEHRTLFVTREEEESLHRDSCSFPTLPAYERSQRSQRSQHHRYSHHLPPPASHRESISHTCRGYSGKIEAGEGSVAEVYPRSFRAGGLCQCFGFWRVSGERERDEGQKEGTLSGRFTHVVDFMTFLYSGGSNLSGSKSSTTTFYRC